MLFRSAASVKPVARKRDAWWGFKGLGSTGISVSGLSFTRCIEGAKCQLKELTQTYDHKVKIQIAAHPRQFGFFLTAPVPRALCTLTTNFDDGFNIPAAKRSRPSNTERVHPDFEHCKRHVWYPTSSSCLRVRQRPLDYDSSTSPPDPRRPTSNSRLSRTRWPTTRTTSTLAGLVVTCAKYSTGD